MYVWVSGVKKVRFSGNLACFVFLKHPFWDSPFWLITNELGTLPHIQRLKWNKSKNHRKYICDAWRDLVPFAQFKKREKHLWKKVTFCDTLSSTPATVLKVILLHGCFTRFLNCTKLRALSHLCLKYLIRWSDFVLTYFFHHVIIRRSIFFYGYFAWKSPYHKCLLRVGVAKIKDSGHFNPGRFDSGRFRDWH